MKHIIYDIETIPRETWNPSDDKLDSIPPPVHHQIVSIGVVILSKTLVFNNACTTGDSTEEGIVRGFLDVADGCVLIDWNGSRFDIPVLQNRIFHYGVEVPWFFDRSYRTRFAPNHFDMSDWWSNYGASLRTGLNDVAILMGLPGKLEMQGKDVASAYQEGKLNDIDTYCLQDAFQTAFVFLRLRYVEGEITLRKYRNAASQLLGALQNDERHHDFCDRIDETLLFNI